MRTEKEEQQFIYILSDYPYDGTVAIEFPDRDTATVVTPILDKEEILAIREAERMAREQMAGDNK